MNTSFFKLNKNGLINLFIIYIVWGSTYLAIRVTVREGAGFTPFTMGATRLLLSGFLLLGWNIIRGGHIHLSRKDLTRLLVSSILLWFLGNGFVMLAEQRASSGLTALILASTPIWVAMMDSVYQKRLPSLLLVSSLIIGTGGIFVLSLPVLLNGVRADFFSIIALLIAAFCWGAGTFYQSKNPINLSPTVSSGYQMIFGGISFTLMAVFFQNPIPSPNLEAWLAWAYLVFIGSIIAFTAFIQAVRLLPPGIVTTYGYVNPIIAVFLGWLILNEDITIWTFLGAFFVLAGVTGVFQSNAKNRASRYHSDVEKI